MVKYRLNCSCVREARFLTEFSLTLAPPLSQVLWLLNVASSLISMEMFYYHPNSRLTQLGLLS